MKKLIILLAILTMATGAWAIEKPCKKPCDIEGADSITVNGSITTTGTPERVTGTNGFIGFNEATGISFDAGKDGVNSFIDAATGVWVHGDESLTADGLDGAIDGTASFQVLGQGGGADGGMEFKKFSVNLNHVASLKFKHFNGNTITSDYTGLDTADNTYLGSISGWGVNTSDNDVQGAVIDFYQDGAAGATYIPAEIIFGTSDGSSAATSRLTITPRGTLLYTPITVANAGDCGVAAATGEIAFITFEDTLCICESDGDWHRSDDNTVCTDS